MFDIDSVDRKVEMFIFDVYIAILKINRVASKHDNAQNLLYDFTSWDSVIREFEIIGEACKYLLRDKLIKKQYQEIVDFRNQITHEYFGIDEDVVWTIVCHDLPDFENIILKLIREIFPTLRMELIEAFIEDNRYLDFVVKELKALNDVK